METCALLLCGQYARYAAEVYRQLVEEGEVFVIGYHLHPYDEFRFVVELQCLRGVDAEGRVIGVPPVVAPRKRTCRGGGRCVVHHFVIASEGVYSEHNRCPGMGLGQGASQCVDHVRALYGAYPVVVVEGRLGSHYETAIRRCPTYHLYQSVELGVLRHAAEFVLVRVYVGLQHRYRHLFVAFVV